MRPPKHRLLALLFSFLAASACSVAGPSTDIASIEKRPFGVADGLPVDLYVLRNARDAVAKVTTYGARVTELLVPDRQGRLADVVLGFDDLKGYLGAKPYFGAIVGRVGNRIAKGRFTLNGKSYQLATNSGPNHLHGGIKGFDRVVWEAKSAIGADGPSVELSYLSRDGEEGYPGNCRVVVRCTLTNENELRFDYAVGSDQDTPVNVTHHGFFNLAGAGGGTVLGHEIMLNADQFTPVDYGLIPTGELKPVAGTLMDLRSPLAIGAHLREVGGNPAGYDYNYVVNGGGGKLALVARVYEPGSGRVMEVLSTEPGVQFYTGNTLNGTVKGKGGVAYPQYGGLCLETQHFPDSVNHPNFPSCIVRAGTIYRSTTIYRFSTR